MRTATTDMSLFPAVDLVPKKETRVLEFLEKFPDYDGRNVRIGILDTGIDPNSAGIRFMADGRTPKLVDMVDCTGSGDVDISTMKKVTSSGKNPDYYYVQGLSGNKLRLRKDWWKSTNQSNTDNKTSEDAKASDTLPTVQLGIKSAYELFPLNLVTRVKAHRKKKFNEQLAQYIADVSEKLAAHASEKHPSRDQVKEKEDLEALMEFLIEKEEEDDPGMLLDCVVFFDGEDQRAVIFTDVDTKHPDGIGPKPTPLAAFARERQFGTISSLDQYNYAVNFYDDNKVLSIVGDCTPHGTHVAAIAAAAEGERSGVAPGAELISIKIGDSRMGSMETGSSIARGLMAAVRLKCDVINLSYGEASQIANSGRLVQLAEELVWRHNIIFVSAVGNNGPALSTVNAPGGVTSCIFGVAAYVSPEMMKTDYSLSSNTDRDANEKDPLVGTTYTWSSVGPAVDGGNGVSVCAPGGAITSVSNWTMQKSMLMNGTSMASPHACGCVALLVSACKAEGIPISPSRIQRAIENTTKEMKNLSPLQQGWGMIQVPDAFEHLKQMKAFESEALYFDVFVENLSGNPRGIYLRQFEQSTSKRSFSIRVNPRFRRVNGVDDESQRSKIKFEMQFKVTSTASWLSVPDHFMLMNNGRSFKVQVDPSHLAPGVHTARICGSDAEHVERGIIWYCPVTVVKPLTMQKRIDMKELEFEAAETKRFFVVPPPGATWMDITIKDKRENTENSNASTRLFVLHTVQLIPHAAYRDNDEKKYMHLSPSQEVVNSISVVAGLTCEVAVGRYWSTAGVSKADIIIEFRGVRPEPRALAMASGDCFGLVKVMSDIRDEMILPSAKFSQWKTPLRPKSEGVISPLGERDIQPWNDKKTYQLALHYEFSQHDKGSFTPRAPALQEVLYESTYESQLMLAFDSDKKYLGYCDAYPSSIFAPKGTVVIKMQIRHDEPAMLEKLKDMTIWIERKLDKDISLSSYATREDLLIGSKRTMKKKTLRKGNCVSVFFSEPSASKIPSSCKSGDILLGKAFYCSGESSLPGDGKCPGGFPVSFTVGPKMEKSSSEEIPEPKDTRSSEERLKDAIRDLEVDQLGKLTSVEKESGEFERTYERLYKEFPTHIPLLIAHLNHLDTSKKRTDFLPKIIEAADKVIAEISEDELALHFGKKHDNEDPEKVAKRKDFEKKRQYLIEAYVRKADAFISMKDDESAKEKFVQVLKKLKDWVDIESNGKYAALTIERDIRLQRYGIALKCINKYILKSNGKDTGGVKPLSKLALIERRCKILKQLKFDALLKREKTAKIIASPKSYKLF